MKSTHQNLLLIGVLATAVLGAPVSGGETATSPGGAWTMQTFMISHWSFPKEEERLKQFTQAGFNTVIAVPEELPYCRKYGWKALLAVPADKAGAYANDPAVWGYHVFDEPGRKNVRYETFLENMEVFHKLRPLRPAYINLNEKDDPDAFVRILKPRVLSYDYYQWWSGREPFFPLLEKFRRAALLANIPLICWVEAVAVPHGPIPANNEGKIRHSVYSALAYGAKGIQWWYWRPESRDVQKINAELKVLGPVLVKLRSVEVFHTAPVPKETRPLTGQNWLQSSTEELILGHFRDDKEQDFILATNRNFVKPNAAALTFTGGVSAVSMLDRKTGKWMGLSLGKNSQQRTLTCNLAPGDGVLLRVERVTPQLEASAGRPDSRLQVLSEGDQTILDITSPSGIDRATIKRVGKSWPKSIVVRLHLGGLESLKVFNGKITLEAAVSSSDPKIRRLSLHNGGDEKQLDRSSPYWTEIRIVGGEGQLPLKDGYFEVTLPSRLFQENPSQLNLSWIDFFRQ